MTLALRRARAATNTAPTPGQREAGNYAKGLVRVHGLEVRIENPKGSTRSGVSRDGTPWSVRMANDYGYIRRTEGADGDGVDVFLGPHLESELVFVVDQVVGGRFDEHKVILGATSADEAREVYLSNYSPGWRGLGTLTALPIAEFKRWLAHHDTTKPIAPARRVMFKARVHGYFRRDPRNGTLLWVPDHSRPGQLGRDLSRAWRQLEHLRPVTIDPAGQLARIRNLDALRARAEALYRSLPDVKTGDGRTVKFVRKSFGKLESHSADRRSMEVVSSLPQLMATAIFLQAEPDRQPGKYPNITAWRTYGARGRYRGQNAYVRLTTWEEQGTEYLSFYDTRVITDAEMRQALRRQPDSVSSQGEAVTGPVDEEILVAIARRVKRRMLKAVVFVRGAAPDLRARDPEEDGTAGVNPRRAFTPTDPGMSPSAGASSARIVRLNAHLVNAGILAKGPEDDLQKAKADTRQLALFGSGPGSIKQNPENRLGVDRIGRPHWVAPTAPARPMRQVRLALGSTAAASTASDFKHFPAPGAVDEAGNPIAQPAAWEVSEEEFVEEMGRRAVQRAVRNAEGWARRLAELKPPTRPARFGLSKYDEARLNVEHWTKRAEELQQRGVSDKEREKYREEYLQTVKKAISSGKPVPAAVIAQRPEFTTARNARARYEKGRHTAFANESIAVNRSLKSKRGFKVKRQDGKPIPHEQVEEIARGVSEVESVLGSLKDLLDWSDLTIAHTNGKHPFLSHYGGLYHGKTEHALGGNVISMGTTGVRALAHELGHWLDFESGRALGIQMRVWRNYKGRGVISTALTDNESHSWRGRSDYFEQHGRPTGVIERAQARINNVLAVRRTFQRDAKEGKTSLEAQQIEQRRVHLGPYWREPIEVWARLVEQYVASELAARHTPAEVAADADYTSSAGWWKAEDFEAFRPLVKQEIERRLSILRAQIAAGVPVAKARLGDMIRRILRPRWR